MSCLSVLIVSATPVLELRAGIPLAIYLGLNPAEAYIFSVLGNFLPVPFLLIALDKLLKLASRFDFFWNTYEKIELRVRSKKDLIEKYGYFGLTLFVAVPLPVTGAWTACLLAFLLSMNRLKATFSILAGICIAGLIVLSPIIGILNFIK